DVAGVTGIEGPTPVMKLVPGYGVVDRVVAEAFAEQQCIGRAVGHVGDPDAGMRHIHHAVPSFSTVRVRHRPRTGLVTDERPLFRRLLGCVSALARDADVGWTDQSVEG